MPAEMIDARHHIPQRRNVDTPFGNGSLDHKNLLSGTDYVDPIRVLPDVNIQHLLREAYFLRLGARGVGHEPARPHHRAGRTRVDVARPEHT